MQVCNISTKPVAPFFGLNTEEVTESPVLLCAPAANSDIQDCKKSKENTTEKVKKVHSWCAVINFVGTDYTDEENTVMLLFSWGVLIA